MVEFCIMLAGCLVKIRANYESTRCFCKDYLYENGTPDIAVAISAEDIEFESKKSDRERALEGLPVHRFRDEYLETLAVYRKICTELLKKGTLLFHGSVIAVDGEGYLFTAKSGTGKSTHAALWRQEFGDRAEMINDDKPLLKVTADGVFACGTPWNGKHRLGCNKTVPLKAICILERSETNHIEKIAPKDALTLLMQQSFRTGTPDGMMRLLDLLEQVMDRTNIYRLGCNMDPEAAHVAYDGMQK